MSHPDHNFDLYLIEKFFDGKTCHDLISQMRAFEYESAPTYGISDTGVVDERVRKVAKARPAQQAIDFVTGLLLDCRAQISEHFKLEITQCEEPQFLCYRVGDYFVPHQDGNTGMLRLDSEARRVSVTIFLNCESEVPTSDAYRGGSLVFHDWPRDRQFSLRGKTGMLVAFRSEITHEVRPVISGQRYAIVTWFR